MLLEKSMTDEERLKRVDLINGTSQESEVLWAINYLLNLEDEDDLPLFAQTPPALREAQQARKAKGI